MAKVSSKGEGESVDPAAKLKRAAGANQVRPEPSAPHAAEKRVDIDLTDRMLGEFRILRRLGRGGMAEVYLAEQTTLRRNVAIKVLHENRLKDPTYLARFQREAQSAAALSHPNIVQVLLVGEQEGIHYIAQEYVPGYNLRELLKKKGPPEQTLAVRIIRQAANALQAAHEAGIVHRDVKLENIMITRKGEVKVADFGLAQLMRDDAADEPHLTRAGVTMGTPLYMSPEQISGKEVDHRSDIYSLGVTCYHLLSGNPPFRGPTAMSIAVQHLKNEPDPLEPIRSDLAPLLCRMVHKMMAKKPQDRYQTAQAILKDLKRLAENPDQQLEGTNKKEVHESELSDKPTPSGNAVVRLARSIWHAPDWPVGKQIWVVLLLAFLAGGGSAAVGWMARTADPFAAPLPKDPGVPRRETAAGQYFLALEQKDNLEAWQAVAENFPGSSDRLFRNYADQHIAMLYLTRHRRDDAQAVFDRLASANEPQFRAFGAAGQAILANLRGDYQESQKLVDKLRQPALQSSEAAGRAADSTRQNQLLFDLLDEKMRSAVMETVHRNIEKLNRQMSQEWDEIFKNLEHSAPPGDHPPETSH